MTFQVTYAIFGEAFLSYIGLGIQPPQTSWGKLVVGGHLRDARNPYMLIFPSLVISLTMLSLQLIGDGLRDATDPSSAGDASPSSRSRISRCRSTPMRARSRPSGT